MFRSPAVYTTYTVHETFQTRAKYQLQKSFQVINSCLLNTIIFWNKRKSDSFTYLSYFISDTMPINKHSKFFFFFFFWLCWVFVAAQTFSLDFPSGPTVRNLPVMQEPQEMQIQSLGQDDPLEKGMETHCSIHAWKIPQTEEPGGLQSIELQSRTWLKWLSMHRTFLWSWWVRAVWRLLTAMVSLVAEHRLGSEGFSIYHGSRL